MSFFGSSASAAPPQEMAARKEAFIQSIRGEMALANAQELMSKVGEKCFQKCVTKPGTSLSSSEETCLSRCMDRYMEAFNIVSRAYITRLSKDRVDRQI